MGVEVHQSSIHINQILHSHQQLMANSYIIEVKRKKNSSYVLEKHWNKGYLAYLSLKYRIKMTATTRTAMMALIIHLFLFILLEMTVNTLLLLPMLSSTP